MATNRAKGTKPKATTSRAKNVRVKVLTAKEAQRVKGGALRPRRPARIVQPED